MKFMVDIPHIQDDIYSTMNQSEFLEIPTTS